MKRAHEQGVAGRLNPIKKYARNDRPCRLYVIAVDDARYGSFTKIGITERSLNERFKGVFQSYTVMVDHLDESGLFVAETEKSLHERFAAYKLSLDGFAGKTECYDNSQMQHIVEAAKSIVAARHSSS